MAPFRVSFTPVIRIVSGTLTERISHTPKSRSSRPKPSARVGSEPLHGYGRGVRVWQASSRIGSGDSQRIRGWVTRPTGFEPVTFGSGGRRSIQLSYGRRRNARRISTSKKAILSVLMRQPALAFREPAGRSIKRRPSNANERSGVSHRPPWFQRPRLNWRAGSARRPLCVNRPSRSPGRGAARLS